MRNRNKLAWALHTPLSRMQITALYKTVRRVVYESLVKHEGARISAREIEHFIAIKLVMPPNRAIKQCIRSVMASSLGSIYYIERQKRYYSDVEWALSARNP